MSGSWTMRLFWFRTSGAGAEFDVRLREAVAPRFLELEGLVSTYIGRRGPGENGERIIASIWESDGAMRGGLNGALRPDTFDVDLTAELADEKLDVLPLALHVSSEGAAQPQILRVFRGEVRDGELEEYVSEVDRGTSADVEAGHGPLVLFLGLGPRSQFVTVSAWSHWDAIEAATGGNIRKPISTRNASRLVSGTAAHYEILPGATAGRRSSPSPAIEPERLAT